MSQHLTTGTAALAGVTFGALVIALLQLSATGQSSTYTAHYTTLRPTTAPLVQTIPKSSWPQAQQPASPSFTKASMDWTQLPGIAHQVASAMRAKQGPSMSSGLLVSLLMIPLAAVSYTLGRRSAVPQTIAMATSTGETAALNEVSIGRRKAFALAVGAATLAVKPQQAAAGTGPKIVVAGATGQTGQLAVKALVARGLDVTAGARNPAKVEKVGLAVPSVPLDVTGPKDLMVESLRGADVVVCCTGFVPGNPFEFSKLAHAVDNLGTQALVDAAKEAGVRRFVLVTSILTNGRAVGMEKSPGFVITNAFGGVLDEKLVAEQHLRASGLEWVIVRPGGLEGSSKGELAIATEDTVFSGEISREQVAEVLAEAAIAPSSAVNRVFEVVETGTCVKDFCPADLAAAPSDKSKWFA
uniref:NAD(P)-binding domain-containing protein n=1 Tax=Eutreptiella gymnastica TaxID=73025 RepID=A0A7S1NG98_9EUGL|mmetsp:Transcript_3117/g.5429  ORF Transcript_3117/g.5429 Transcript_3117/m.5429 type:complete len:413 (+) Transcript_3117:15-1253(+)